MKTKTNPKWVSSKKSYKRGLFKATAFVLLVLSFTPIFFIGLTTTTGAILVGFLLLMLFALQEASQNTTEKDVNNELEEFSVVQASEGNPVLSYDKDQQLDSVTLAGIMYQNPKSYSDFGDDVYLAKFEIEEAGWLIIVIEGEPHTKNQKAVAFRSISEGK